MVVLLYTATDLKLELGGSKLGISYVDLYLIHSPEAVSDIPHAWEEFERAQELGLVRSIGVSNFNVDELRQLENSRVKPAVNQVHNPLSYFLHRCIIQ